MSVIEDIADALGVSAVAVKRELNRAAVADAVLAIVAARFYPHVASEVLAKTAGVAAEDLRGALLRFQRVERRTLREETEARRAKREGKEPRKRHEPIGKPPSPAHRWCTRGDHWCAPDDMARNSSRKSGFSDWCRACWREYWHKEVKPRSSGGNGHAIAASAAP